MTEYYNNKTFYITFPTMLTETKTLLSLHQWMNGNQMLLSRTPIFADIRVFSYPLLLIAIYSYGIYSKDKQSKYLSLYLFSSTIAVFAVNAGIKLFVSRPRPYDILSLDIPREELMLQSIPTDSFPSDHAWVSASIAMWLTLRGIKHKQKHRIYLSIPFWLMSISMWLGRVMIGIHRPTDIITWMLIWIIVAYLLIQKQHPLIKKIYTLYDRCIQREKNLRNILRFSKK